jgi:hypothetical protein
MKMDLRFASRPLEDIWCEAVVALIFEDAETRGDGTWGLDRKTSGLLSHLRERGFWTAAQGERLLIASQDMIKARMILLMGMGSHRDFGLSRLGAGIRDAAQVMLGLGIDDMAIRIPLRERPDSDFHTQLAVACGELLDTFRAHRGDDAAFLLKVVLSLEPRVIREVASAFRKAMAERAKGLEYTILFESESEKGAAHANHPLGEGGAPRRSRGVRGGRDLSGASPSGRHTE